MNKVFYSDPGLLKDNGYKRISVGIRPSGSVHIGTALTFLQGLKAVYDNDESFLDAYVLDLDFDRQREKDFVSYLHKRSDCGCHELMREHTMEEISHMLDEMCSYLGVDSSKVNISYFSDLTENPQFQNYMAKLFGSQEGRILLKESVIAKPRKTSNSDPPKQQKSSTLISPVCYCGHSSVKPPKMVAGKDLLLRTDCYNDGCDVEKYELSLTEPRRLNIHFMAATVRDFIEKGETKKADIHIFGGDYMLPTHKEGEPKAMKVSKFFSRLSRNPPKVYVGPLLLSNKKRIRKSRDNCYTLDCIVEKRSSDWTERLNIMLEDHLQDFVIDMSEMEKYFS